MENRRIAELRRTGQISKRTAKRFKNNARKDEKRKRNAVKKARKRERKLALQRQEEVAENQEILIVCSEFRQFSSHWSNLALHGPFHCSLEFLDEELVTNRPIFDAIRLISLKIYENSMKFVGTLKHILHLIEPEMPNFRDLLEEMCESVWTISHDGSTYELHNEEMYAPVEGLFHGESAVICRGAPEIGKTARQLDLLLKSMKIPVSLDQLQKISEEFTRFGLRISCDFCFLILETENDTLEAENRLIKILNFKELHIHSSEVFYAAEYFENMELSEAPQILTSILTNEEQHLLENVLDYGLIQILPENAKNFLTKWITSIQLKMNKKKEIRIVTASQLINKPSPNYGRLKCMQFVGKTTSGKFPVIERVWKIIIREIAEKWITPEKEEEIIEWRLDSAQWTEIIDSFHSASRDKLSELFSDSPAHRTMLKHIIAQLFRFVCRLFFYAHRQVVQLKRDGVSGTSGDLRNPENPPRVKSQRKIEKKLSTKSLKSFQCLPTPPIDKTVSEVMEWILNRLPNVSTSSESAEADQTFSNTSESPESPQCRESSSSESDEDSSNTPNRFFQSSTSNRRNWGFEVLLLTSTRSEIPLYMEPAFDPAISRKQRIKTEESSEGVVPSKIRKLHLKSAHEYMKVPVKSTSSEVSLPNATGIQNRLIKEEAVSQKWLDAYNLLLEWNAELKEEVAKVTARLADVRSM